MNPQAFVIKWRSATLKERAAAQEHFIDVCRLVGHPTPAEDDPTGEKFAFEKGAEKTGGGQGYADVWKRHFFAWEYKGKHADLETAYRQLLLYREALENPPLLVVSDMERIIIRTNFTNTVRQEHTLTLDSLLTAEGQRILHALFYEPESFRALQTPEQVTQRAAQEFARLAEHLRASHAGDGSLSAERVAHFLIRLLFCLFAEDIRLLPKGLFTRLIDQGRAAPEAFNRQLRALFAAMAVGDFFGEHKIKHFDGGLFENADALPLNHAELVILHGVAGLDWSSIEPSIFGTLFERSLDPQKRSQLGAHYTSKDDILLIVEPVLMQPLRRLWEASRKAIEEQVRRREERVARWEQRLDLPQQVRSSNIQSANTESGNQIEKLVLETLDRIRATRVLDPACGSGNFLYVALRQLLDLEKEAITTAGAAGIPGLFPQVSPRQLFGIEINPYAHELAQATVWIGYIQWLHENGYGEPSQPILQSLDNIKRMDAILAYDEAGNPVEPEWPQADVIIGNPPFLGGGRIRSELGNEYTEALFQLYGDRLPNFSDLVCYWFERSRALIEAGEVQRAGLLATNSIRGGANRKVLERIKQSGDIFMAWGNRPWILEGAAVRVSMVGFDNGTEIERTLDGEPATRIDPSLTQDVNLTVASPLKENASICFMGPSPKAPFDIPEPVAHAMLSAPINVNGKHNSEVVRPVYSAIDIARGWRRVWTIDFAEMSYEEANFYEAPFEYVRRNVLPVRAERRDDYRGMWWQYARPRPEMRAALSNLERFISTPGVAKHRIFVFVEKRILCNQGTLVFARDDDYFFGVLHSKSHELWSLRMGTSLEDRPRYTPTTTFETFPFPWPPGKEAQDDPRVQTIAQAAADLVRYRDNWLNPQGASDAELKKRTLTNLYNERPAWLDMAHKKLDAAVFAAYGWPADLADEEILARLLALNLERAAE